MFKKNYQGFHRVVRSTAPEVYEKVLKHGQIVKFLLAGGTGAFVDLSTFYLFTYVIGLWYVASSALSFTAAFWVSFGLHKFWTFRDRDTHKIAKQTALYFLVAIANLCISTMLIYFFVDYLSVHKFISKICASAIIAIESFIIYRYVIFAKGVDEYIEVQKYETSR